MREDRRLQGLELPAGLEPEVVDERPVDPPVRLERVGLPARAVQREHVLPVHPLAVRVLGRERAQLLADRRVRAALEVDLEALLEDLEPQPLEALALERRGTLERDVGERRAVEQAERLAQDRRGRLGVARAGPCARPRRASGTARGRAGLTRAGRRSRSGGSRSAGSGPSTRRSCDTCT